MINPNTKLNVLVNSTDRSRDAFDFSRDSFDMTLTTEDYLYVGYYKPVNSLYFALETANINANTLKVEFYNGTAWVDMAGLFDDTKGLLRSGFIMWDRNQTNQSTHTLHGLDSYWVRISTSANQSQTTVQGINFLFCDDQDLKTEVPEITDENHLAGKASHLLTHVAVRNQIIQDLNNKDLKKTNQTTGLTEDLTCWDILDATQIKQAAMFLALSKIYFNFSDAPDDKYYQKYLDYSAKYRAAYELSSLYLDSNDDGELDSQEQLRESFSIIRIKR